MTAINVLGWLAAEMHAAFWREMPPALEDDANALAAREHQGVWLLIAAVDGGSPAEASVQLDDLAREVRLHD